MLGEFVKPKLSNSFILYGGQCGGLTLKMTAVEDLKKLKALRGGARGSITKSFNLLREMLFD